MLKGNLHSFVCFKNRLLNTRLYINKFFDFDVRTAAANKELRQLNVNGTAKAYSSYDIFNISEEEFEEATKSIFSDPVTEECLTILPKHQLVFALEYLPGQFDIRADSAMQCCQLLFSHNQIQITSSLVYGLDNIDENGFAKIKKHFINTIDSREKSLQSLKIKIPQDAQEIKVFEEFLHLNEEQLNVFLKNQNLSIDIEDLKCIQDYFIKEKRNPTETELKVLDTYWSDHCRHTTFLTQLQNIEISGDYETEIKSSLELYYAIKKELGREIKPTTLMDLATIIPKYLLSKGLLPAFHHSKENNAATIKIQPTIQGKKEDWLLLFKNETHNHPTEIEPFGGAATCIGGAIRDPLSGRAFVYQAMRLSGAANPLEPIQSTISNKLPQQKISREAALGYSSYGNQIGLATSHVAEIYDDGYKAKRFECGFVVGAVKADLVKEETPQNGDVVLLIGGDTGRDGIGGASGSSKQHNEKSITTMQAEVQKGNATVERKIQKLFRKPHIIQLIKKSNDFGAGGVCVAIGEIADSVDIDLNSVPLKYAGLNGTEIAISESQERIAVVVEQKDADLFINEALKENLKATVIANITNHGEVNMIWNNKNIVSLKRDFLQTNGSIKNADAAINISKEKPQKEIVFSTENFLNTLSQKSVASQKGMIEHFDSTVLGTTCLMPFGGKFQLTPSDVSAHFICDATYTTDLVSIASWGYHPEFTKTNPYIGSMYSIIESISKIVAAGGNYKNCYLTFQEYYEKLGNDKTKWGKPLATLLGALEAQYNLNIAAIGGKDSMSGTFNEINVPPTFVSFAITTENSENIISSEFKNSENYIYLFKIDKNEKQIPNWDSLKLGWNKIYNLIQQKNIVSAKHIKDGGIATAIAQMSFGNKIGAEINTSENLLELTLGDLVIESNSELDDTFILIGRTIDSNKLVFNHKEISIEKALNSWTSTFENLFPTEINHHKEEEIITINYNSKTIKNIGFGKPNILIPVFPGTNCEFETADAFKNGNVDVLNFNNISTTQIQESIDCFVKQLSTSQILVFSGGFSAGDEPDGSAKFIVNILKNEIIKDSIHQFLYNGGLILGICNGFQALIKSGLLPYGKICTLNQNSPTLTHNNIGRHVSQMVKIKVVNDNSPWLQNMKGKFFIVPVSHGEGRFYATNETLENLILNQQIATQYVHENLTPTNIFPYNPNGSINAVEGLISTDGKIFGRMAHPERMKKGRFKNIPEITYHDIFSNGINYFL